MQNDNGAGNKPDQGAKQELGVNKGQRNRKGPAERMWAPIKLKLGEDYNYVSKNWGLRFLYYFAMFVGMPFAYLYYRIKWKYRVFGKENVKKIRKQSAVTVANHIHNVDAFMLTAPFYPQTPYFVALKHNFEAFLVGGLVRVMRGIPLPEELSDFERFSEQVGDVLQRTNRKIHMFPEGEIAPFSRQLRPFKNGAFHFAVKNNVPVLPMVFVFPKRRTVKLIVGEPIYLRDVPGAAELSVPKQVVAMAGYVKAAMQKMMDDYYIPLNIDTREDAK